MLLLRIVLPLAALTVLVQICYPLVTGGVRNVVTVATVLLFAATSLAHAAATRGGRAAAALCAITAGGGLLAELAGRLTGFPFGRYSYGRSLGPALLGIPVAVPLAWTMLAWPAYLAGRRLSRGRRCRVVVAAWALASWDLFLDPQMVAAGHWRWAHPAPTLPGVTGVPVTNYLGWLLVALLMVAGLEFALPRLAAAPPPAPAMDSLPCALYVWTWASSVLAHAAFFGLPASALWGGVGMGLVAVPLARSLAAASYPVDAVPP